MACYLQGRGFNYVSQMYTSMDNWMSKIWCLSLFLFFQEVIDENDPKLLSLKNDLGEEAYVAVVTALKELHEYHNSDDAENTHNSSEKQVIPEIWDSQNGRRATVTEALKYISNRVIKMRWRWMAIPYLSYSLYVTYFWDTILSTCNAI